MGQCGIKEPRLNSLLGSQSWVTMLTCSNQHWFIAYAITFTLIACTGILGNIFNISILYSGDQRDTKLLKRTGAMFLLLRHLAASDLLFLVSTLHVLVLEGKRSIVKLINWLLQIYYRHKRPWKTLSFLIISKAS